jgi:predicted phosphoribosyltransferase
VITVIVELGEESAMPFKNRTEAGRELAVALAGYKDQQPVVLALPRGGVVVAVEVAGALAAPLDLILVRKVGVPFQPELAMGAVVDGGASIIVRNEDVIRHAGIDEADFTAACRAEFAEIERGANCIWEAANAPKSVDATRS